MKIEAQQEAPRKSYPRPAAAMAAEVLAIPSCVTQQQQQVALFPAPCRCTAPFPHFLAILPSHPPARYYLPLFCGNTCLVVAYGTDIFVLKSDSARRLAELPPAVQAYSTTPGFIEKHLKKTAYHHPTAEHCGEITEGYYSPADSLYFLENDSVIHLWQEDKTADIASCIRFYPAAFAATHGMTSAAIKANPLYRRIPFHNDISTESYPFNYAFVVSPGYVEHAQGEYPLHGVGDCATIDFLFDSFSPLEHPHEIAPFARIPQELCHLSELEFDHSHWEHVFCGNSTPDAPVVFPFYKDGECMAELIFTPNYGDYTEYPYHDCNVLTLRHRGALQPAVNELIRRILEKHPNILAVPRHLASICHSR